jgi:SdrD B-like protein
MRGSLVVLALVASPFLAASAQGHSPKRTLVPLGAKCTAPARGNSGSVASTTGQTNRVDPTQRGNKDCPAPQSGGGGSTGGSTGGATVGHSFVTGMLFNDPDALGAFDGSQFGLAGWTVQLTGPAGTLTAVTDGNGNYSFSNLDAGSYTLCVVPPGGWINTAPSAGVPCPGSSNGYTIDAPSGLAFDVYFSDYNFGFQSAPW